MLFSNLTSELVCLFCIFSLRVWVRGKKASDNYDLFVHCQQMPVKRLEDVKQSAIPLSFFVISINKRRENCSRSWCQNMARSVGDNSCANTAISCQLCAHVLHSSHVPAERAFVLFGSLSEQTGAWGSSPRSVSLFLCLGRVTVAATGNVPGMISLSSRWLVCMLPADHGGTPLMNTAECCLTSSVRYQFLLHWPHSL